MAMPEHEDDHSAERAPLVVRQRRVGLVAAAVGSLVVALVAMAVGVQADGDVAPLVWVLLGAAAVLSCIVFAVLAGRAGPPLLVVDTWGVTTGRLPKVKLGWAELERVRVFQPGGGDPSIGIFPASVDDVAAGLFGDTANASKYAARLRSFTGTKGAPIVVSLKGTSLGAATATTAITSLAAGRAEVTG